MLIHAICTWEPRSIIKNGIIHSYGWHLIHAFSYPNIHAFTYVFVRKMRNYELFQIVLIIYCPDYCYTLFTVLQKLVISPQTLGDCSQVSYCVKNFA